MKILSIIVTLLIASPASGPFAQGQVHGKEPAQTVTFEPLVADVRVAPYRASINVTINISKQRLDMRNATIVNMIDFAHGRPDDDGREDNAIVGGPTWIDLDRFDVVAMLPSRKTASSNEERSNENRAIVERILAERFHLRYRMEDRPLPGYLMTVGKDGAKLAEAKDPTAPNNCETSQDKSHSQTIVNCTSETLAQFFAEFGGVFRHPVIDRTGLTKPYDFTLRFSSEQLQTREDSIHAYIDVFARQLGLVLAAGQVPQRAIVVDKVDQVPTPTPPEIAKLIPTNSDLEFEVATIKPAADDEPLRAIRLSGSQISFINFSMQELLTRAWEFRTGAMLGNRPEWLDRRRYTIQMKLPQGVDAHAVSQNSVLFNEMLRKLLTDRFQMKYHWGEQTVADAYVLLAGTPKMKKADPNSRSYCKYGPAEGEKDMRRVGAAFNGEFHCQNMTMDQFADLAQGVAGSEIKYRLPNRTGLAASYDFTLYYTSTGRLQAAAAAADAAAKQAGVASSDPVAGISLEDAFRKQLGLRLERRRGFFSALILDHIEEIPTAN